MERQRVARGRYQEAVRELRERGLLTPRERKTQFQTSLQAIVEILVKNNAVDRNTLKMDADSRGAASSPEPTQHPSDVGGTVDGLSVQMVSRINPLAQGEEIFDDCAPMGDENVFVLDNFFSDLNHGSDSDEEDEDAEDEEGIPPPPPRKDAPRARTSSVVQVATKQVANPMIDPSIMGNDCEEAGFLQWKTTRSDFVWETKTFFAIPMIKTPHAKTASKFKERMMTWDSGAEPQVTNCRLEYEGVCIELPSRRTLAVPYESICFLRATRAGGSVWSYVDLVCAGRCLTADYELGKVEWGGQQSLMAEALTVIRLFVQNPNVAALMQTSIFGICKTRPGGAPPTESTGRLLTTREFVALGHSLMNTMSQSPFRRKPLTKRVGRRLSALAFGTSGS